MTSSSSAEREVLPIPDRPYDGPVFEDAKDPAAKFPPIEPLRPPADAPNVLIMLLDDAGFAPLAETLKLNGYATAQFGKCHEVPVWETSPLGPFDSWPTGGGGFEYFYGFLGVETNQYYPALYEGTTAVEQGKTPQKVYHFTEDMTDRTIEETCDVGVDTASPVSDDYTPDSSRFTGSIKWVQIDIDEAAEDVDRLLTPEERFKIAITRQ